MRIAYFDCFSGISGDMTIAAFLDAGLRLSRLSKELSKLKIRGYKLSSSRAKRGGISGTSFSCVTNSRAGSRSLKDILSLIKKSGLSEHVKESAVAIFENIGRAEAKVHGVKKNGAVHLHELGELDSIIDIVGVSIALEEFGIDAVYSSVVDMGRTFVDSKHGCLPIPGPACLELMKDIPVRISEIDSELVTPTGAGILKTLSKGFGLMPSMNIEHIGYGAGSRTIAERPNMLRMIIGSAQEAFIEDTIAVMQTNIDDMSPQFFGYIIQRLLDSGALDAYTANIQMKKTRPAYLLTVLAERKDTGRLASIIFRETTTTGIRVHETARLKLDRTLVKVKTRFGKINVKVARGPEGITTISPEYEDCVKIAKIKNVPLKEVYNETERAVKAK